MLAHNWRESTPGLSARGQNSGLQTLPCLLSNQRGADCSNSHSRSPPTETRP